MTERCHSSAQIDERMWRDFVASRRLVFLDGASASGKSTIKNLLLADQDLSFAYAKRYTTREQRADDAASADYIFVSMEEFLHRQNSGDLIEHRHFLFGMSYGVGQSALYEAGADLRSVLAIINLGAVAQVKARIPQALCILIDAPVEIIEQRLRERGMNTEEQIAERLANAREVKRIAHAYDFVLENGQGDIEGAYSELKGFLSARFT